MISLSLFRLRFYDNLAPFFYSIKPTLKKVSKYENKFAKLQEKAAKFAFANQLKAKDK